MVVRLSGTQPQGPKHLETLENKTVDGTQNTVRVNRGTSANRPVGAIIGDLYYNTEIKDLEEYTEDGWLIVAKQVPRVPTIGAATLGSNNDVSVSFTPSQYGQPASSYTAQSNPGSYTATGSSSPIVFPGTNLQVGTAYTFRIKSSGTYGESSYSSYSSAVTPITLGSFESIAYNVVGAGGTNEIVFSSIPQTYTHLQIRGFGRMTNSGSSTNAIAMRFNSDSGTNYANHRILGENAFAYGQGGFNMNLLDSIGQWPLATSATNVFGATVIDILDYTNVNKFKTLKSINGSDGNNSSVTDIALASGLWRSTSPITSISLSGISYAGGFAQYSSFGLYGIKGA